MTKKQYMMIILCLHLYSYKSNDSQLGVILCSRDTGQCLEIFLIVKTGVSYLHLSEQKSEILINNLQYIRQNSMIKNYLSPNGNSAKSVSFCHKGWQVLPKGLALPFSSLVFLFGHLPGLFLELQSYISNCLLDTSLI